MRDYLQQFYIGLCSLKEQYGLSGAALKRIAIITMFIDHAGATVVSYLRMHYATLFTADQLADLANLYTIMRRIGRLAFPIFCFFIVEGYFHTRNVRRYALRLFALALISEFPFDYALHYGQPLMRKQNVYWTLLIGLLVIYLVDKVLRGMLPLQMIVLIGGMALAWKMRTDYSFRGVFLIETLYIMHFSPLLQCMAGAAYVEYERMPTPLAFALVWLYNGRRGKQHKYFFYFFYPAHLMLLGITVRFILPAVLGY